MPKTFIAAVLLTGLAVGSCAVNPATGQKQFTLVSEKGEYAIGDEVIEQAVKENGGVYKAAPALNSYYQDLAQKIARVSERGHKDFQFYFLDDPMVNAFALPGHIAFSRGLLPYLNSEAELASIVGHEVGHVAARHTAQRQTGGILASLGVLAAQIAVAATTNNADLANATGQLAGAAASAGMASYSRANELEADRLGLKYMALVGYNPRDAQGAFEALKRNRDFVNKWRQAAGLSGEVGGFHRVFASHPDEESRIQQIIRETQAAAQGQLDAGRDRYLRQLDGLTFGMKPNQVIARGQTLYGPKARAAITFDRSFVVNGFEPALPYAFDPQRQIFAHLTADKVPVTAEVDDLFYQLTGLTAWDVAPVTVNGMEGVSGWIRAKEGQNRLVRLYVVKDTSTKTDSDGNPKSTRDAFVVTFNVPQKISNDFLPEADRMVQSLRRTTAAELADLKPWRVDVRQVKAGETAAGLARQMPAGAVGQDLFYALNGLESNSRLQAGQWVKLVVAP